MRSYADGRDRDAEELAIDTPPSRQHVLRNVPGNFACESVDGRDHARGRLGIGRVLDDAQGEHVVRLGGETLVGEGRFDPPATEEEIREFCRGKIAHFKIPQYLRFVDTFPMTVTGKVP